LGALEFFQCLGRSNIEVTAQGIILLNEVRFEVDEHPIGIYGINWSLVGRRREVLFCGINRKKRKKLIALSHGGGEGTELLERGCRGISISMTDKI
jgi:hypothetical protein